MKTNEILIIGGVGVVLMLAMQKKARAAAVPARGGAAQPGVSYATPTAQNGLIASAVNGILNWVSGTPKGTPGINGNVSTADGSFTINDGLVFNNPVDSLLGNGWWNTPAAQNDSSLYLGNDGSASGGSNPQNGTQLMIPNLASFWTGGVGSLE